MPSSLGTTLSVSVFGQSHSPAIGGVVEGLPSGLVIDQGRLARFMARRAPGQGPWATPRREADRPRFVAGLNERGATCGAPLAFVIENADTRSRDYDELRRLPRPGHADLTAWAKWHGNQDVLGGGHFSGRLTAPLCVAGGVALQQLAARGVRVAGHLASVADVRDEGFSTLSAEPEGLARLDRQIDVLEARWGAQPPTLDADAGARMLEAIDEARRDLDSVGGVIECVVTGLPAGIGSPPFDGMENLLARALFGIPAVKGVEFGRGFAASELRGSQNNDPYRMRDGRPRPVTNNAGGILGGITTGAPVVVRVGVKPTPSIAAPQRTVDLVTLEDAELAVRGRHDPCVAVRAVPVVEALCALTVLDAWLSYPPEPAPAETARHD